jgi:phenylacetic acid degradation operon negative regulatory protein
MPPTAKGLVVEMLMAIGGADLPAHVAVRAGALFGLTENNVRVALVRLAAEGRIAATRRGSYRLARRGEELLREVASWRAAERGLRRWRGGYVAVHAGALGRADRAALRRRERALRFLGFVELERDLHLRPDNLPGGVDGVRARLLALGLPRAASVFLAAGFGAELEARARRLWDGRALDAAYRAGRARIERWLSRAAALPLPVAAREVFVLGGEAVRAVVSDPLLPAPLVDVAARRAFFAAVRRVERVGRELWRKFLHA